MQVATQHHDDLAARDAAARILPYVRARRTAFVDLLRQLVALETPSLEPETIRPALRLLAGAFEALELQVTHLPGTETAGHLYARPRHRDRHQPYQLLLGHCDTVWPAGTLARMPIRLNERHLKGPGVFDMKAGIVQIIFALETLRALRLYPAVMPVVLITSDEEIGSVESQRHIERLARRAHRALVLEPALGRGGKIKTARKGTGDFEIIVKGKAAHAGLAPEEGASAILELSHVIQKLFALNDPQRGVTVNVGTLDGGLRTNVVAPEGRITVDVRVPTREDARQIDAAIRNLEPTVPGVALEIRGGMERVPMEPTPRNQALWQTCRALGTALGLDLEEGRSGGASDGNFTSLYTATLDGLGAVGDGAHAEHEFIDVDRTLERCALLALLLLAPPTNGSNQTGS